MAFLKNSLFEEISDVNSAVFDRKINTKFWLLALVIQCHKLNCCLVAY